MRVEQEPSQLLSQEAQEYCERLQIMALEIGVPTEAVNEADFTLAAEMLAENRRVHGNPESHDYKHYHNGEHPVDFIGRFWRIWKIGHTVLPERFDIKGFRDGTFVGAAHEYFKSDTTAPGVDEKRSANWAGDKMSTAGYPIKTCLRVNDGIIVTTAIEDKGRIIQPLLRDGSRDPLKLVAAWADTGGVFMEGIQTLVASSFDLYYERGKVPLDDVLDCPPAEIAQSFQAEDTYIRDRLAAFPDDLRYYFPDKEERHLLIKGLQQFEAEAEASRTAARILAESTDFTTQLIVHSFAAAKKAAGQRKDQLVVAKQYVTIQLSNLIERVKE